MVATVYLILPAVLVFALRYKDDFNNKKAPLRYWYVPVKTLVSRMVIVLIFLQATQGAVILSVKSCYIAYFALKASWTSLCRVSSIPGTTNCLTLRLAQRKRTID